ncbi:MAG: Fis family transcriptional regulator [Flavobacterium sp.]|nr:MAG: Fis family transcriptional regulator [Flavobacterium sp.]
MIPCLANSLGRVFIMKNKIDIDLARKSFSYDKNTGELKRITGRASKTGKVGTVDASGVKSSIRLYLRVYFNGKVVYAHRLIWAIMVGEQAEDIDHKDGNGLNNRWDNLRSVSHSVNGRNQKQHSTNTSGVTGIAYRKDSGKWRARIMVDTKMISLGTFKNKEDAIIARKEAEKIHGYMDQTKRQ